MGENKESDIGNESKAAEMQGQIDYLLAQIRSLTQRVSALDGN